jgi:hypothetical protein
MNLFPLVNAMPGCDATATYWKVGDGLPHNGNCCGYDAIYTRISNGRVAFETRTKPAGAVDIDEAEYAELRSQIGGA